MTSVLKQLDPLPELAIATRSKMMKVFISGLWIDYMAPVEVRRFQPMNGIVEMDHLPRTVEEVEEIQFHMTVSVLRSLDQAVDHQIVTSLTNMVIVEQ